MFDKKSKELYSGRFVTTLIINKMCVSSMRNLLLSQTTNLFARADFASKMPARETYYDPLIEI